MKLDHETWLRLYPLLEQAHGLSTSELSPWLARLIAEQPEVGIALREVLAQSDDAEDFLAVPLPITPVELSRAGQRVGPYTIDELLAQGGMGDVWLAHRSDGHFKGRFAIKLLHHLAPGKKARERFRREGRVLARFSHPNIARLIDAGVLEDGLPYLVLEYVDGEHIDSYCDSRSLSMDERIHLFLHLLAAIELAHTNLIIHRDIKPSNVLVTADGTVKLLDFGIAKLIGADPDLDETGEATRIDEIALTPNYAAPEQILGEPLSTATDVYQLGVLLHVLLVGQLPLMKRTASRAEQIRAAIEPVTGKMSDLATAGRSRRDLQGDLDAIVEKTLRKRPDERYSNAAGLTADLQRYLDHEPVIARERVLAYRAQKFIRRYRRSVISTSLTAVALIVAAAFAFLQMREAQTQRDQMRVLERRGEAENKFLTQVMSTIGSDSKPVTPQQILEKGLELLDRQYSNDPAFRIDVIVQMAEGFLNVGDEEKGYAALTKAETLARPLGDARTIAEIDCTAVEPEISMGHLDRAVKRLAEGEEALGRVAQATAIDHVRCLNGRARVLQAQLKSAAATNVMLRALDLMERSGETLDLDYATILSNLEISYADLGDLGTAHTYAIKLVDYLQRNGWGESELGLYGRHLLAVSLSNLGQATAALAEEEPTVMKLRSGTSDGMIESSIGIQYSFLLWRLGHWEAARSAAQDALRAARRDGDEQMEIWCMIGLTRALSSLGNLDDAAAEATQARDLIARTQTANGRPASFLDIAEASILRARGRLEEARGAIESVIARLARPNSGSSQYLGDALQESSRIALAQQRFSDAQRDALKSADLFTRLTPKPELSAHVGESLLLAALAQRGSGDVENSRRTAARAFDPLLSGLGSDHAFTLQAAAMR